MLEQQPAKKVILVVDDDLMSRTKLAIAVEKLGYRAIKVSGGKEAIEELRTDPVDAVLLDLMMPEMDGFEVLQALRDNPDIPDIPVVVVSSLDDEETEVRAIRLGAKQCITKGFESSVLRMSLDAVLSTNID